jgi:hypothetical protein
MSYLRRLHPSLAVATLALSVSIATASPAAGSDQAAGTPKVCALLSRPEILANISGPGEEALRIRCESVPPEPVYDQSSPRSRRSADILVNDRSTDVYPHITQSETSVAVSGSTVLVGFNDSGEFRPNGDFTGYARSTNGGASFTDMRTPTTPLGDVDAVFGDPVMAADVARSAGETEVFYFENLAADPAGLSIISVHKTIDGGATWAFATNASPLAAPGEFQDKEWVGVDTRATGAGAGNVYACWRRFGGAGGIQFSRSTDGGLTFTQLPSSISANPTFVQGCQVAVSPLTGAVFVSWTDSNTNPPTIRFRRSTDQGRTFDPEITVGTADFAETVIGCGFGSFRRVFLDSEEGNRTRAIRSTPFSSLDVDPVTGAVYLAWHRANLAGGSSADIAFSRSTDGGLTFSSPTRINSDIAGQQFFASIAANSTGLLHAIYYSTQNSPTNRLLDVYEVSSSDGGVTWSAPARVTDVSFDRPMTNPNFDTFVAFCYMGDYIDVSAAAPGLGGTAFSMAWGDNRLDGNPLRPGVQPDPDIRFDTD